MYRILIADDEGLMRESLSNMIRQSFDADLEIETAKSGRSAIEQAETFHPDIIFMDIQMPGINGIQALKEIRKFNSSAICFILTAYDTFDYAQEAVALGVEKYLLKPISKKSILPLVAETFQKVDQLRNQRSAQLRIQEKLETIIPLVESGFVTGIILQEEQDLPYYRQLLDIQEEYGYVMVLWFGSEERDGRLISPVGVSAKIQGLSSELNAIVKSWYRCIVGSVMNNRLTLVIPTEKPQVDYEERIRIIENAREMLSRLESRLEITVRVGIGKPRPMGALHASYEEALMVLQEGTGHVIHADDIKARGRYEDEYPAETETSMYRNVLHGDITGMQRDCNEIFNWMIKHYPNDKNNIRLKVLEFILFAEKEAFRAGAVDYGFSYRKDYLSIVLVMENAEEIRNWFLEKMTSVTESIRDKKEEQSISVISRAKRFIQENYCNEISLDDVSREMNISPYYFSKLFKEEEGINFIEYLTALRIDRAKELLSDKQKSVKEISSSCGYADPNYFSRLFKKLTDMTPREYRDSLCAKGHESQI